MRAIFAASVTVSAVSWGPPNGDIGSRRPPDGYTATFQSRREDPGLSVPSHPPKLPTHGAVTTGQWRNMFVEMGMDEATVSKRVDEIFEQLFVSGDADDERLMYEAEDDTGAYILSIDSNDVRSEGMSYGMMIAAQRNNATMFDLLWRWAKTHMRHADVSDARHGMFSWHCTPQGGQLDANSASDGETWMAAALYTAAARWQRDEYAAEAAALLEACTNKTGKVESVTSMFNNATGVSEAPAQVVFVPYANSATFTDPSYHLPNFYWLWAQRASASSTPTPSKEYWEPYVTSARAYFPLTTNCQNGLAPDYSTFAGAPTGGQRNFAFDAWRVAQNVAMDFAWLAADERAVSHCNTLLSFFHNASQPYGNQFDITTGRQLSADHSPGLVAMNAVCALASDSSLVWDFLSELWHTPTPSGHYRYYDGCLYMLAWLQLTGQMRYYEPLSAQAASSPAPQAASLPAAQAASSLAARAASSPAAQAASSPIVDIFSASEVAQCGDIRIPQMSVTPTGLLLVAQCRNANQSAGVVTGGLGDNMVHAKVVTKFSADFGLTWRAMRVLTPIGHSHGQVVYDSVRRRVLLHYQYHPNVEPTLNSTLFQRVSEDDGGTWGSERVLTPMLARCNPRAPQNMQVGSAGSKIQTSSGRILFLGHAKEGLACRWWTDDGGDTYSTSLPYAGNEASVAETAPSKIYMNARGLAFAWKGNRSSFWSVDDGSNFSAPIACPLREDEAFGCSAGLLADPLPPKRPGGGSNGSSVEHQPARLFLSEPAGPGRKGLVVHCSLDGGESWPLSTRVNGERPAAYSAMRLVKTAAHAHRLLVVWEEKPTMRATLLDTTWCREPTRASGATKE